MTAETWFRVSHATMPEDVWAVNARGTVDGQPMGHHVRAALAGSRGWIEEYDFTVLVNGEFPTKRRYGVVVIEVPSRMRGVVPADRVLS